MRLNFHYLKIIHFFHLRCHPKNNKSYSKSVQKTSVRRPSANIKCATFEAKFMKSLSNTKAQLKKSIAYK